MTTASSKTIKFLRILIGIVLIAVGSFELFLDLVGPEPIVLGWVSDHTYIRVVPTTWTPPVYSMAIGAAFVALGTLLAFRREVP